MARLLLVEDDEPLAEALALALRGLGHDVEVAGSGERALEALAGTGGDGEGGGTELVLLDVMLPGIDGFEVCRRLRRHSTVPVVLLTARGDPIDVVVGLEGGADDYVVKPAEPRVVDARVKAILRRVTAPAQAVAAPPGGVSPSTPDSTLVVGDIRVDTAAMVVTRGGAELHLTSTELRLLLEFAHHPGQVLTRRALLQRVWDYGFVGDSRLVDAAVARLRAKVEPDPGNPTLLRTVRGIGYRLDLPSGQEGQPGAGA